MPAIEPVTAFMALAFCAVHLFVGRLRFLDVEPRSRWLSFAGGVAVAYVFLHILPELGAHGATFQRATGLARGAAEAWVYTLSLAGLALFYGIERALVVSRGGRERSDNRPGSGIFWLHIAASGLLIFIVAYLLNHREDATLEGLALFFVALLLHFVTADFASRADHPEIYDRAGRWVLVAATLAGWIAGLFVELPAIAIGGLFAFVAGAMILVILKEELPEERESSFWPFLCGAVLYAGLVLAEFYLAA
jgi:zinc transporter ZupT